MSIIIRKTEHEFAIYNKGNENCSPAKAPSICNGTYVHMVGAPVSHQTCTFQGRWCSHLGQWLSSSICSN